MHKIFGIALAGWLASLSPGYAALAAGTLISLGDTTSVPIERLKAGDMLAAPGGKMLPVVAVAPLTDPGPMLTITTDKGRSFTITVGHLVPVQDEGGIHLAESVDVGDLVMTETGAETIAEIVAAPAGTEAYRITVGERGTTARDPLFANGVLVSDEPS
jgi:hypothetical protein